ncbi:MAG: DNA integrity scanning protein DisA nucleotide-binding domain protein [Mycoplasmatales bacterium]|nr:DNA integrity scanning protein DisA nucleotide-binding domain protein [Mycoplasmatales bacterium]
MELADIVLISLVSVAIVLLLAPMIFKGVMILFKKTRYTKMGQSTQIRLIRQLDDAINELASTKTGAIITIINRQEIDHLRTDGIKVDANISSSLIIAIFNKNSPIHDGALIIDNNKISFAGTYYKITSRSVANKYGARHRAALGISEQSDSLTIVVSEETGKVSFVKEGTINIIRLSDFQEKLIEYLK